MLVIAGLSLKNLKPRVWDPEAESYLPCLRGVMVSYADFHAMPAQRAKAMEQGLHAYLGVPRSIRIFSITEPSTSSVGPA
jgi:7-cyano-7-deazaguanine tRNA-ribosyltransferase